MLEIGNPGLNDTEAQAQMSMWAISPSPLLAGADLAHMSVRTREIYTNREVLAVNQDPLGAGAVKIAEMGPGLEVWAKPLESRTGGSYAVMLLNATEQSGLMKLRWSQLDLLPGVKVRDLWLHKNIPAAGNSYRATVPARSAVLLRVSGTRSWQHGVVYEAEWPGVERIGAATLFPCGECSRGYAMALGGGNKPGSLRFSKIFVPKAGKYMLRLQYTRNGIENKQIGVEVNGVKKQVLAVMRSWNWADVPVTLRAGDAEIEVSYAGQRSFYGQSHTLASALGICPCDDVPERALGRSGQRAQIGEMKSYHRVHLQLGRKDRQQLAGMLRKGRGVGARVAACLILRQLDQGQKAAQVAVNGGVARKTVRAVARHCEEEGLESALHGKPRPGKQRALDVSQSQRIIAMACGPPPQGRARWSVRLIAAEAVKQKLAPRVGRGTISIQLESHELKPWWGKRLVHDSNDALQVVDGDVVLHMGDYSRQCRQTLFRL